MGLFSSIGNVLKEKAYESKVKKLANVGLTLITSPIKSLTNFEKAYEQTTKKKLGKLVMEGAENTLLVTAPFTSIGKTALLKVGSKLISTPKNIGMTIVGGGAVAGLSTTKTGRNILSNIPTPSDLFSSAKRTTEKIVNIYDGNGGEITGKDIRNVAIGLGIGGAVVGAGALAYDYYKDKKDDKVIGTDSNLNYLNADKTDLNRPTTIPERETTSITGTKRKRYIKKKEKPSIRINNAIAINNTTNGLRITNKRYLNEVAY